MDRLDPLRRRSPGWVRASDSNRLHGIATSLLKGQETEDLSDRQEWLWNAIISELEWRWHRKRPVWQRCSCYLCVPPFPDDLSSLPAPLSGDRSLDHEGIDQGWGR
jgi:hypothetical protein